MEGENMLVRLAKLYLQATGDYQNPRFSRLISWSASTGNIDKNLSSSRNSRNNGHSISKRLLD